jgi:hypothetical protein
VDLHALDPTRINPDEDMVQQAWHFRDERWVSIDPALLDPATLQEQPGGERPLSYWAETTPGSDSPGGLPHDPSRRGGSLTRNDPTRST